jgi:hypothetical protein
MCHMHSMCDESEPAQLHAYSEHGWPSRLPLVASPQGLCCEQERPNRHLTSPQSQEPIRPRSPKVQTSAAQRGCPAGALQSTPCRCSPAGSGYGGRAPELLLRALPQRHGLAAGAAVAVAAIRAALGARRRAALGARRRAVVGPCLPGGGRRVARRSGAVRLARRLVRAGHLCAPALGGWEPGVRPCVCAWA